MFKKWLFLITTFLIVACGINFFRQTVFAQTPTDTLTPTPSSAPNPSGATSTISECSDNHISVADCPGYLQDKLNGLHGQEKTLTTQIAVMNGQIDLTQARIDSANQQISGLQDDIQKTTKQIGSLQGSLDNLTKVLLNRIVENYKVGQTQSIQILLTSQDATDFMRRENYLRVAQEHDQRIAYDTLQAKNDYANEKNIFETKKQKIQALQNQLLDYNKQLDSEKADKQNLLSQTQGNEANYQQLLTKARAQLASFSRFVSSQGGAGLLSGQTSCDGWGCYYNQRDSQWGGIAINGQSGYSMAGYGCLITSISMVLSHMGHTDILPGDIAMSGGNNFAVDTAMLAYSINVKDVSLSRVSTSLDAGLQSGPVIVGIYAYGGTHYVVLKSGSNGSYTMDDPYIANGHDISFTDHYSVSNIFEKDKVVIQ